MKLNKECSKCGLIKNIDDFYKNVNQCKKCVCKRRKKYRLKNIEAIKEYNKEYKKKYNKEYNKRYYEKNRLKLIKASSIYQSNNKDKRNMNEKNRRDKDYLYKMKIYIQGRTYKAFKNKGYSKNTKTQEMLGVDWIICKKHIERQFVKGMNWDNYGEWHIDHIIPLASAKTLEELNKLCHYRNLQPLWAKDNISKKDKIEGQQVFIKL